MQSLTGAESRSLGRITANRYLTILNFHQVSEVRNPYWAPLNPKLFDGLLGFLKANFEVVTFRDLDDCNENATRPRLIVSFDDGYYNFVEFAMPIMERHNVRANLNVIPSCVLSGRPMWNIRLYDFLNSAPVKLINEIRLPGFDGVLSDNSEMAKVRYGLQISRFLKMRPRAQRDELMESLNAQINRAEFVSTRMMTLSELREAGQTHELGVHSFSHESMEFEDMEFFETDFLKCRDFFAESLAKPLSIYAFPNGSHRPEQIDYLLDKGIEHVLLVDEDFSNASSQVHRRFTIYGDSPAELRLQSLGFRTS